MDLVLRPTLFGGQIVEVLRVLRDGCRRHAHTLVGAPECRDCRVIQMWEPELSGPPSSISTPAGYLDARRVA